MVPLSHLSHILTHTHRDEEEKKRKENPTNRIFYYLANTECPNFIFNSLWSFLFGIFPPRQMNKKIGEGDKKEKERVIFS